MPSSRARATASVRVRAFIFSSTAATWLSTVRSAELLQPIPDQPGQRLGAQRVQHRQRAELVVGVGALGQGRRVLVPAAGRAPPGTCTNNWPAAAPG
jgi:hypothetical protein